MHKYRAVLLATVIALVIGCVWAASKQLSAKPSLLSGNPSQTRDRLFTHIPIGTPRKDAERLVASLGLNLTPPTDLGFSPSDSVHCQQTKSKLFGQVTWLIQIDCPGGKVTDIVCEQFWISYW